VIQAVSRTGRLVRSLQAQLLAPLALREFDRRDRPLSNVASDGDAETVEFVKPNALDRPGLSIGEDHGLADKFGLRLLERAEDG
jgi:hypothetical protein